MIYILELLRSGYRYFLAVVMCASLVSMVYTVQAYRRPIADELQIRELSLKEKQLEIDKDKAEEERFNSFVSMQMDKCIESGGRPDYDGYKNVDCNK